MGGDTEVPRFGFIFSLLWSMATPWDEHNSYKHIYKVYGDGRYLNIDYYHTEYISLL